MATLTTTKTITQHTITHEVKHRTPDYLDIITIALPALTFLAGYFLNNLVEKRKEKKRLQRVKSYFFTLATTLETAMRRQAEDLRNTAQRIDEFVGNDYAIHLVTSLRTERIRAIPDMDLFTLFVGQNNAVIRNTSHLNAISDSVDLIDSTKARISENNADTFERLTAIRAYFNSDIEKFVNLCVDYITYYSSRHSSYPPNSKRFFDFVEPYIYQYKAKHSNSGSLPEIYNLYIKPIYEGSLDFESNSEIHEMLLLIRKLYSDYEVTTNYRRSLSIEYTRNSMNLDSARTELIDAVNALH